MGGGRSPSCAAVPGRDLSGPRGGAGVAAARMGPRGLPHLPGPGWKVEGLWRAGCVLGGPEGQSPVVRSYPGWGGPNPWGRREGEKWKDSGFRVNLAHTTTHHPFLPPLSLR